MLDRDKAKILSKHRILEAQALLQANCFPGAYYLAGYAVELALKAVICKSFQHETIPDKRFVQDIHTHNLTDLMKLTNLKLQFDKECKANAQLDVSWTLATKWNENSRYEIKSQQDAASIIQAINDPKNGILSWIEQHW